MAEQTFQHGGKTYQVPARPGPADLDAFAGWLSDQALTRIEAQEGTMPAERWNRRFQATIALVGSGALAPGTPEFGRALETIEGQKRMALILLRGRYPEVTETVIEAMWAPVLEAAYVRVEAELEARSQQQLQQEKSHGSTHSTECGDPAAPSDGGPGGSG